MECEHAYIERSIDYVLCDKEPKPNRLDRASVFHAVCTHQAHCPKENCHKLTPSWLSCLKLAESNEKSFEGISELPIHPEDEAQEKPSRSRRKPQTEE